MSYLVLGRDAYPYPVPITRSEFYALSYLLPVLAQPEMHSDDLNVAFLSRQDLHTATMILSAIQSEHMHRFWEGTRERNARAEAVRESRRQRGR